MNKLTAAWLAAVMVGATAANATTITKDPDLGAYWEPLSSEGTYVYSDSFVAPSTGTVSDLGVWLIGGSSNFVLEVLANGTSGPDGSSVLATTGVQSETPGSLSYFHYATTSSQSLTAGTTYWFAASTVGLGGSGSYQFGGHSQNSEGIADNGTFWFSNDPSGQSFDGRNYLPEIAFSVTLADTPVPEPATLTLLGAGLAGLLTLRRRPRTKGA